MVRMARLLEEHPEWTVAEAVEAAQDLMARARFSFIPDDLEYLRAGGRVSNAVALVGRVLGIHPLIELLNGQLIATQKLRGKLLNIGPKLLADYAERENLDREELWIVRAPGFTDELHAAMEESAKTCGFQKVNWLQTGGVITAHGGKGAFGVAGFTKKD